MPVNNGVVQRFLASGRGGGITIECYYDNSGPYDPPNQPLINDPSRGHGNVALWCENTTDHNILVHVTGAGIDRPVNVPPGETTRNVAQLASVGITTREDAQTISLAAG